MDVVIEESFSVAIFVALIKVMALRPATTATKTVAEDDLRRKTVAERLTDKTIILEDEKKTGNKTSLAEVLHDGCGIRGREGHKTATCFLNPLYAYDRLGLSDDKKKAIEDQFESNFNRIQKGKRGSRKTKRDNERKAMAHPQKQGADMMLVDSGTSAHISALSKRFSSQQSCNIDIALGDHSKVHVNHKGVRKVV